jgi:hypothetical protein
LAADGSFLVEEFINAITSQLDKVQDALRIKAVNRPLTYALKDLTLELKVFVDMDPQGNVRFRASGPNEAGSSVIHLGFTTITKPMIEENTISLAATKSASLDEIGLSPEEQQRLERVGVHNVAQLNRLGSSTGVKTVARLADIDLDRLKQALAVGQPQVHQVQPVGPGLPPPTQPPQQTWQPPTQPQSPPRVRPGVSMFPPNVIHVSPSTNRLNIRGANLFGADGPPTVKLNDRILEVEEAEPETLTVRMPAKLESGALEVSLPDGNVATYELRVEAGPQDQWAPNGGPQ